MRKFEELDKGVPSFLNVDRSTESYPEHGHVFVHVLHLGNQKMVALQLCSLETDPKEKYPRKKKHTSAWQSLKFKGGKEPPLGDGRGSGRFQ